MYIREHDRSAFSGLPLLTRKVKRGVWGHGTSEDAKAEALRVMTEVLGSLGPANVSLLYGIDVQLHIIPYGTKLTDVPEFNRWRGVPTKDGTLYDDLRGMGGQMSGRSILFAVGEETLVPVDGAPQPRGTVACHESGHVVARFALTNSQKVQLQDYYTARKKTNGPWIRDYAGESQQEYFAEATCAFFGYSPSLADSYRAVYKRSWLKANDPPMYRLLADIFKKAA